MEWEPSRMLPAFFFLNQCENCFTNSQSCHSWFMLRKLTVFSLLKLMDFPLYHDYWPKSNLNFRTLKESTVWTFNLQCSHYPQLRKCTNLVPCRTFQKCETKCAVCHLMWLLKMLWNVKRLVLCSFALAVLWYKNKLIWDCFISLIEPSPNPTLALRKLAESYWP